LKKIRFGTIHADYVTMSESLDIIENLAKSGNSGFVVTPNIDHVVLAQKDFNLRVAYADASLSLVDGMPLKWMSSIVGEPLPEKISGSDLIRPLMRRAGETGLRVYFLGAAPGVARKAGDILESEIPGLNIVGVDSPPMGFDRDPELEQATMDKMLAAKPNLVCMALGCPKQELLMHRWYLREVPAVLLGIGASLDFIAGNVKRCPPMVSELGFEWAYRITQDPKRLLHRYLVRDSAALPIFLKMLRTSRKELIFEG
jgi:N-acetylglucosaminyldiphosphoundecaprenol N-acetyl-beta-D-mannosaminyltransferase